jgi:hypothetical protein
MTARTRLLGSAHEKGSHRHWFAIPVQINNSINQSIIDYYFPKTKEPISEAQETPPTPVIQSRSTTP